MIKNTSFSTLLAVILMISVTSCTSDSNYPKLKPSSIMTKNEIQTPEAPKQSHAIETHGDERIDDYYWMRLTDDQKNAKEPDEQTQKVLTYLKAENGYRDQIMEDTKSFQDQVYDEIVGRIKKDDTSVPYKYHDYFYLTRYEEGREHPMYSRKKDNLDNKEEILLDANVLSEPYDYYHIGGRSVSPDNRILAYGEDTLSRRIYTVRFKDLKADELLEDILEGTSGGVTWAADNKTVFYTKKDEKTLRSYQIYRHILGTDQSDDALVFTEEDETFYCYVYKTKSEKYIVIGSSHTLTSEFSYLRADNPTGTFDFFQERDMKGKMEYYIAHYGDKWYVRTNLDAQNFKLMETPEGRTSKENWKEIIPHRKDVLLEDMDIFKNYLVLSERKEGITQLRVIPTQGDEHYIEFPEKAHLAYAQTNLEFDTDILRYGYQSMTTPASTFDYHMISKDRTLLKEQKVVGSFDKKYYRSDRVFVEARDGAKVPVSIVYHKDTKIDGQAPCLLYGYGSYGSSMDPYFSSARLSLLDRGFVYAIAHIRGGAEMGRQWYEDGKLLNKKNTFNDFIDCGKALIDQGYADKDRLFAMGGSAGGLLIGAVINMEPDLWKGAVAGVPFVDVVTTMLDETIPLTTFEFDEWGNPKDKEYYEYIKSYSPYDNVKAKDYPALLITTGLFDSQVQYWEPAKWCAKMREYKTDTNPLLMYCNMDTGHGGASGRFERHKETAMEYSFLLDLAGLVDVKVKG